MNPPTNQQNNQQSNQQDSPEQPAEPLAPQGFEGDSNQRDFSNQPAEQPAQQPKKEEGIKEEGIKEECLQDKGLQLMRKEKNFNIREINGTKPLNQWMERGIEALAKREYGLSITVKVKEIVKRASTDEIKNCPTQ